MHEASFITVTSTYVYTVFSGFRCLVPYCDLNLTFPTYNEKFVNYTIPIDSSTGDRSQCSRYKRLDNNSSTCKPDDYGHQQMDCPEGKVFDTTIYKSTLVSEVCVWRHVHSTPACIFFLFFFLFGVLLSTCIFIAVQLDMSWCLERGGGTDCLLWRSFGWIHFIWSVGRQVSFLLNIFYIYWMSYFPMLVVQCIFKKGFFFSSSKVLSEKNLLFFQVWTKANTGCECCVDGSIGRHYSTSIFNEVIQCSAVSQCCRGRRCLSEFYDSRLVRYLCSYFTGHVLGERSVLIFIILGSCTCLLLLSPI